MCQRAHSTARVQSGGSVGMGGLPQGTGDTRSKRISPPVGDSLKGSQGASRPPRSALHPPHCVSGRDTSPLALLSLPSEFAISNIVSKCLSVIRCHFCRRRPFHVLLGRSHSPSLCWPSFPSFSPLPCCPQQSPSPPQPSPDSQPLSAAGSGSGSACSLPRRISPSFPHSELTS